MEQDSVKQWIHSVNVDRDQCEWVINGQQWTFFEPSLPRGSVKKKRDIFFKNIEFHTQWNLKTQVSLDLPSTLIPKTELFVNALETGGIWKHWVAFRFRVDRKHFENGAFLKWWCHDNHDVIYLTEFSLNINPKWPVIVAFWNFPSVVCTENIWCAFSVKPPFLNSSGLVWTWPKVGFWWGD